MTHLRKTFSPAFNKISILFLLLAPVLTLGANDPLSCSDALARLLNPSAPAGAAIPRLKTIKKPMQIHLESRPRNYDVVEAIERRLGEAGIEFDVDGWLESIPLQGHFKVTVTTIEQYEAVNRILHDYPDVVISAKVVQPVAAAPAPAVKSVPTAATIQPVAEQIQAARPTVQSIENEVRSYLTAEWSHFSERDRGPIFDFIVQSVLSDPAFQENPGQFLVRWREHRGGLEMLITPDDQALSFLEHLRDKGELGAFAKRVREAGLKSSSPDKLLTARWQSGAQIGLTQEANTYFAAKWGHMKEHHDAMIQFLQNKVLADPAFQNNPEAFLARWIQERGGLEMLVVPADPVKQFLEELYRTRKLKDYAARAKEANFKAPQGEQVLSAEWDAKSQGSLSTEVKAYLDKEWRHFEEPQRAEILKFIQTSVLADPLFQKNPTGYLTRWFQNRSGFDVLMTPQDQAKAFLESLYRSGKLASFAARAKQAGLKPTDGVQLFSATWQR